MVDVSLLSAYADFKLIIIQIRCAASSDWLSILEPLA